MFGSAVEGRMAFYVGGATPRFHVVASILLSAARYNHCHSFIIHRMHHTSTTNSPPRAACGGGGGGSRVTRLGEGCSCLVGFQKNREKRKMEKEVVGRQGGPYHQGGHTVRAVV